MMRTANPANRLRRLNNNLKNHAGLYLLLVLPVAYLIVFNYIPIYGVLIAFKDFKISKGILGSEWADPLLRHFIRFFEQRSARRILMNTLRLSIYGFLLFPLPVVFALILHTCPFGRLKRVVQTVSYLPHFISTVVFVGMVNVFFMPQTGLVNQLMRLIGNDKTLSVLTDPKAFDHLYIWTGQWKGIGWGSIMYLAALAGVSPELHESAVIDGANKIQRIWHIDLPGIRPTVVTLLILSCSGFFGVGMERIYLMQNSLNLSMSEVLSTYVYKQGIEGMSYGYSTAVSLMNSAVNIALMLLVDRAAKLMGQDGLF